MHGANVFLDQLIVVDGTPDFLLLKSGPKFVNSFSATLCMLTGLNRLTKTACYLHKIEIFINKTRLY